METRRGLGTTPELIRIAQRWGLAGQGGLAGRRLAKRRRLRRRRRLAGGIRGLPDHAPASTGGIWRRAPCATEPEDRACYQARERERSCNHHQQRLQRGRGLCWRSVRSRERRGWGSLCRRCRLLICLCVGDRTLWRRRFSLRFSRLLRSLRQSGLRRLSADVTQIPALAIARVLDAIAPMLALRRLTARFSLAGLGRVGRDAQNWDK